MVIHNLCMSGCNVIQFLSATFGSTAGVYVIYIWISRIYGCQQKLCMPHALPAHDNCECVQLQSKIEGS